MALTSSCKVLLLNEILSELSTEDTTEVPKGGVIKSIKYNN